jgi:hypothetical protein
VTGKSQNTGKVVADITVFLLAIVSHWVEATVVDLTKDVKQERIHIKVKSLVIQKELGNIA